MQFKEKLKNYANLIVAYGLNIQPGQHLNVGCELIHRELAELIAKAAYQRGAKFVNIDFVDPELAKIRILNSQEEEYLSYVPSYLSHKYQSFITEHSAVLRITGSEEPDILAELPPGKVHTQNLAVRQALKTYYEEGVGKSKVHWTVAAAATPQWGKKVFPELNAKEAFKALWEAIFTVCRADKPDCLELWKKHNETLQARCKKLTDLKIKELHFTGPETDLKVRLSQAALFKGGSDRGPLGVEFEPNIPTEECFTTPDYRYTQGTVRVTRPIFINGRLVKDLKLTFKNGEITDFSASEGLESFKHYINADEGARRLGEVALVGIDSPVFQSNRVFQEILFDENAACHIAVGFAYRFCLKDGPQMSSEKLEELGCNTSHAHLDMMISDEKVNVTATTYGGQTIPLIEKGAWV
jgi:aminopeptidase